MSAVVLVVDDDAAIRETLVEILSDDDYEVAVARDGREALEVMRRLTVRIVLLDLMMPKVSGWQVLAEMQQDNTLQSIPVCVLSANARDAPPGSACLLHKPVKVETLLETVRQYALPADGRPLPK